MTTWLFEVHASIRCCACRAIDAACLWCAARFEKNGSNITVTAPTFVLARAAAMRRLGVQPYDLTEKEVPEPDEVHLRVELLGNDMTAGGSPNGLRAVDRWSAPSPLVKKKRAAKHLNGTGKPLGRGLDALFDGPKPTEKP
jgi:hypothetical protein